MLPKPMLATTNIEVKNNALLISPFRKSKILGNISSSAIAFMILGALARV
jgi:hypothetical protein